MKFLIDTNVLLDMAIERNENHEAAGQLIKSFIQKKNEGFVTSHSVCDFFYIVRKDYSLEEKKNWIDFITNAFTILTEDKDDFVNSTKKEFFADLEDQLQMECAEKAELDFIVTSNLKDFSHSAVAAISVRDACEKNST